jgi:hypothetical protein
MAGINHDVRARLNLAWSERQASEGRSQQAKPPGQGVGFFHDQGINCRWQASATS